LSGEPSIARLGACWQVHRNGSRQPSFTMRVVDGGAQHTQFAPGGSVRAGAHRDVSLTRFLGHLRDGAALPNRRKGIDGTTDAPGRRCCWSYFLGMIGKHVGHEDFSGITRPGAVDSQVEEFGECDFSLCAICRARAALPTAAAFGPDDVITSAFFEEVEPRA
jgi:hypothetical protein